MSWHVTHLESCESTQVEAIEQARNGAANGTVIVSKAMSGGKGQRENAWHAPEGGWYASLVLRDIPDPRFVTLALGNAVAELLEIAGADAQLKWVNDVLVGGKKIAGVLVDAESTGDQFDFLVAGIGINFNGSTAQWPAELNETATTLEQELGVETCIEDNEPYLLESIGKWLDKVRTGKHDDIIAAFRARDVLNGKRVNVDGIEGTAEGITDDGHLIVSGEVVTAGTVAW